MSLDSIDLDLSDILTDVADIVADNATTDDSGHTTGVAGQTAPAYLPAQACKLLPDTRRGSEFKRDLQGNLSKYVLYIMPTSGSPILEQHWVMLTSIGVNVLPAPIRYNIVEVLNPVIVGAPIELRLERVKL